MDVESRVELPVGHLVNLSPRPHNQTKYQAYRAHYTAAQIPPKQQARNGHRVPPTELEDSRISNDIMFQKKATKLPIPKSTSERPRDQRHQTPSPTGIPKPYSAGVSSGGSSGPSGERNRDPCWMKLRERFEKESPLSQRGSYIRTRETDRARSREVSESWQQEKYAAAPVPDDRRSIRSNRSAIPNPSANSGRMTPSTRNVPPSNYDPPKKWRTDGDQWVNYETRDNTPQKSETTDTASDSSPHSNPSISPVSADDSMTDCDWEDRFVVHMPSAKDPSPPTMTADQIEEYQKSIEKKRRTGRRVPAPEPVRPSPRPSPRSSFGDNRRDSSTQERRRVSDQSKNEEVREPAPPPHQEPDRPTNQAAQNNTLQPQGHWYSPDEVGKNRISTIWEESPTRTKDRRQSTPDGSFLGCKEINGPGTKNPDEILLFASGEESNTLQPRPLAIGAKKRLKEKALQTARKSEDKAAVQEEWSQISQNSKQAQSLKPSSVTMCQDASCPDQDRSESQNSSKENSRPRASTEKPPSTHEDGRGDDDVFIITPTITRTLIPTPTPEKQKKAAKKISVLKAHGLRRPGGTGQSGTGEAVKAVRAKAQVISTPSGLRPATGPAQPKSRIASLASSKASPPRVIASKKEKAPVEDKPKEEETKPKPTATPEKQKTNSIRGFIRTSGLARSTGLVRSPTESLATILRNGTESLRNRAESLRNGSVSRKSSSSPVSQISPPTRDNSESSRSERSFRSAKETPPSSTKPSPVKNEVRSARVSLEKPPPRDKTPPVEPQPPPKKPTPPPEKLAPTPTEKRAQTLPVKRVSTPPDKRTPTPEILITTEKSAQPERLSRQERLERFKEQARARRATKNMEIAELDGQQVAKDSLQANITDVRDDLSDLEPVDKDDEPVKEASTAVALSLIFEIVFMAITNMHRFGLQTTDSPYIKFMIANVVNMTTHCYQVFTTIYQTVAVYQATGTWPKAKSDQAISRFLVEFFQALVYLVILGFGGLILGRAAGYILLIGSWALWFAKPFAWVCQGVTRALLT